jgi:hypothetical protein
LLSSTWVTFIGEPRGRRDSAGRLTFYGRKSGDVAVVFSTIACAATPINLLLRHNIVSTERTNDEAI